MQIVLTPETEFEQGLVRGFRNKLSRV